MKFTVFAILVFSVFAHAQDAHVVPLSADDARQSKYVFEKMKQAEADWADEQKRVAEKYLVVKPGDPDGSERHYQPPWKSTGITFAGITYSAGGGCLGSDGYAVPCGDKPLTKQEINQRDIEERAQKEQEKTWRDAYDREPRIRKGFGESDYELPKFEFSQEFKFIVPAKPPEVSNPCGSMLIPSSGTVTR